MRGSPPVLGSTAFSSQEEAWVLSRNPGGLACLRGLYGFPHTVALAPPQL